MLNLSPQNANLAEALFKLIKLIYYCIYKPIKLFEKYLEKALQHRLKQNRSYYIDKTKARFANAHPSANILELEKRLNIEADRVYAIVDRSILRERIQRSRYLFFIGAIFGTLIIGLSGGFFGQRAALSFIAPFLTASVAWMASIATIHIGYNQRVKGGMDTVYIAYEREITKPSQQARVLSTLQQIPTLPTRPQAEPIITIDPVIPEQHFRQETASCPNFTPNITNTEHRLIR